MLVQLGQRPVASDVVELLSECHGRIRNFMKMATRIGAAPTTPADIAGQTAGQIRRYFAEAFPLHLADEEELVLPALMGHAEGIDDALASMHAEHADHAPLVKRLIELCESLQDDPRQLVAVAAELVDASDALDTALEPHLLREEQEIFPALRALSAHQQDRIKEGMRARREAVLENRAISAPR
jgi:iron-sulfur cluster repair protein YtfE (RIC family)